MFRCGPETRPPYLAWKGGDCRVPEDRFPTLWSGSVAVIRMPPEVDVTIADEMREALLSVLNLGASAVVVDMTRTTFCDSAGISALVRASRRAAASGAKLRVASQVPAVLRLFTLVGVTQVVGVHPDVAGALGSLPRSYPRAPDPGSGLDAGAPRPAEG